MGKFIMQMKGVMYRKLLIYKRSYISAIVLTILACIFFTFNFAVKIYLLFDKEPNGKVISTYKSFFIPNNISIARIINANLSSPFFIDQVKSYLIDICKSELGVTPNFYDFESFDSFNDYIYDAQLNNAEHTNFAFSYEITNSTEVKFLDNGTLIGDLNISYQTNTTSTQLPVYSLIRRAIWKISHQDSSADFSISTAAFSSIGSGSLEYIITGPILCLAMSFVYVFFIGQINEDIKSPQRSYMFTCGLSIWTYWFANFVVDWIISEIFGIVFFFVAWAGKNRFVMDYPAFTFFAMFITCFSCVLYTYCWAWVFDSKNTARIFFIFIEFATVIVFFTLALVIQTLPKAISGVFNTLFPINMYYAITNVATRFTGRQDNTFGADVGYDGIDIYVMIMAFADILYFILILAIIEFCIYIYKKRKAISDWKGYENTFVKQKDNQPMTDEALAMEDSVKNAAPGEYAVRINDVSKLFYDSAHKPICAVNQVSLGIKAGSLFGFLGANGAGKTTLMKIILRELQMSNGTIELEGEDISKGYKANRIALCPQFDDHLSPHLTSYEQIKFYSYIHQIPSDQREHRISMLIETLELTNHADKLTNQLSGGNQRKISVAIAFLSDAHIILLDEPTSSLDPVARHKVHNLINVNRGEKTFMLCTHLLDEAEALCDNISIMLNGCVYAIGTPQYLSSKFGTEWKCDIVLDSSSKETEESVERFFRDKLPNSRISIKRPLSRIYSVPSQDIKLTNLFQLLQEGKDNNIGIKYYTCSCSTLEKVFLEIIMLSERGRLSGTSDEESTRNRANTKNTSEEIPSL